MILPIISSLRKVTTPIPPGPGPIIKNPQLVVDNGLYSGFGHVIPSGPNEIKIFTRIGTGHLEQGYIAYYKSPAIGNPSWSGPFVVEPYITGKDYRDVNGVIMDDGRHAYSTSISANGLGGGSFGMDEIFIRVGDPHTSVYGAKKQLFGTGGLIEGQVPMYPRCTMFGKPTYLGTPGHYGWILAQFGGPGGKNRFDFVRTTDYWTTATAVNVVDSVTNWSEACVEYHGSGRYTVFARLDFGSYIYIIESTDDGATFQEKGQSNLGYSYYGDKIIFTDQNDDGTVNIFFQDRDTYFISVSENNDPAVFFNKVTPTFYNEPRIYAYNYFGSTGNPALGYFSRTKLPSGGYACTWTAEYNAATNPSGNVAPDFPGVAKLWFTKDTFILPARSTVPPTPRTFTFNGPAGLDLTTYVGTNYFRVDIIDYTLQELDTLIEWFEWDLTTDPTFSGSFVTTFNVGDSPPRTVTFQNFRAASMFIEPKALTPNTTYYFRARAVSSAGVSAWKSGIVTTLGSIDYLTDTFFPLTSDQFNTRSAWITEGTDRLVNGVQVEGAVDFGFMPDPGNKHEVTWRPPKQWDAVVKEIRIYPPDGTTFPGGDMNAPTKFYAVRRDTGAEVFVGDYTNTTRNVEVVLTVPGSFVVERIIARGQNVYSGQQGVGLAYGSEWRIKGDYKPLSDPTVSRARKPLGSLLGADGGPWDQTVGGTSENTNSIARMVQMGLSSFRQYWHARRVYKSESDTHAWQRTMVVDDDGGGWPLALCDDVATTAGIQNIWSLIQITDELKLEWGGIVNVPFVNFSNKDDRENPLVHWRPARMAFVVTAREGGVSSISDSLMGTQYVHPTYGANTIAKGRNKKVVFEIGNEKDVTYADVYAYENGRRMGPYLSAIYDGHKGTINVGFGAGVGVGIKNADPNMQVVIAGFSLDDARSVEAMRGIYDWSKENRGMIGTQVDLPFDVINYHHYSSNKAHLASHRRSKPLSSLTANSIPTAHPSLRTFTTSSSQGLEQGDRWRFSNGGNYFDADVVTYDPDSGALQVSSVANVGSGTFTSWFLSPVDAGALHTCGMPPELSDVLDIAKRFVHDSDQMYNSREVWITEWGFDINPVSALNAKAYASYNEEQVAAIWSIRTILGYAMTGIDKTTYFRYTPNFVPSPVHFDSMGLVETVDPYYRYYVGDFFMQLNRYKDYKFDAIIEDSNVKVYRFIRAVDSKVIYFIWGVESKTQIRETKFFLFSYNDYPTYSFTENSGSYNLQLTAGQSVFVRHFQFGGSDLSRTSATANGSGILSVSYNSIPTVVTTDLTEPSPNSIPAVSAGVDQSISFGATLTLTGSATDTDGILRQLWTKISGPVEKGRSNDSRVFNTGTINFTIPPGMYFTAGMTNVRAYVSFDGYLIGTVVSYNSSTGAMVYNATSYHTDSGATVGNTYNTWDLGQESVITSQTSLTTTVTGCVPGTYVFRLIAEDNGHALGRDYITVTVT
jgi:hypothetical protein